MRLRGIAPEPWHGGVGVVQQFVFPISANVCRIFGSAMQQLGARNMELPDRRFYRPWLLERCCPPSPATAGVAEGAVQQGSPLLRGTCLGRCRPESPGKRRKRGKGTGELREPRTMLGSGQEWRKMGTYIAVSATLFGRSANRLHGSVRCQRSRHSDSDGLRLLR